MFGYSHLHSSGGCGYPYTLPLTLMSTVDIIIYIHEVVLLKDTASVYTIRHASLTSLVPRLHPLAHSQHSRDEARA